MKLIIEIDDDVYKHTVERSEYDTLSFGYSLMNAVANGTPLPEKQRTYYTIINDRYEYGGYETLQDALDFYKLDSKAESIIKTFETREVVYKEANDEISN